MKTIHILISCLITLLLTALLSACTADVNELFSTTDGNAGSTLEHSCKMTLNAAYPAFLDDSGTRAEGGRWEEGDQIYIRFSSTTYGVGTYTDGDWVFDYTGKLVNIQGAQCAVYYFKGGDVSTDDLNNISFDANTVIFSADFGSYSYSNNFLSVSGTLRPQCSRIRFRNQEGSNFQLSSTNGLKYYTNLNLSQNQLSMTDISTKTLTFNPDGYTDYWYVTCDQDIKLTGKDGNYQFYKDIEHSKFKGGASGVITIPLVNSHLGWAMEKLTIVEVKNSSKFNFDIKTLANGHSMAYNETDSLINNIEIKCNSSDDSGVLVSDNSDIPIYANYNDGTVTISTAASVIYLSGSMNYMFSGYSALTNLDLSNFDTRNVTNMEGMFSGCSSLTNLDLSGFDTRNVTNMENMFYNCTALTTISCTQETLDKLSKSSTGLDLTKIHWNRTDGEYVIAELIDGQSFNMAIKKLANGYNMSKTDPDYLIKNIEIKCNSSVDSGVLVSNSSIPIYANYNDGTVTISTAANVICLYGSMNYMFSGCSALTNLDLSGFDTRNVTGMDRMFSGCSALTNLDLASFDTSNVTGMRWMFYNCSSLTSLSLGLQFVVCDEKGAMCRNLANDVSSITITCTETAKAALQDDSTWLDNSKVSWSIIE